MADKLSDYEMSTLLEGFDNLFEDNNVGRDGYNEYEWDEDSNEKRSVKRADVATKISQGLKKKDIKHFHKRLISLFENSNNSITVKQILAFINYVLKNQQFIPGYSGIKFCKLIQKERIIPDLIIHKFQNLNNFNIKKYIIGELFKIDSFFTPEQCEKVLNLVLSRDYFLIKSILYASQYEINDLIERIIESKNIYMVWILMEHFIELSTTDLEPYIDRIRNMNHIILNEKINQYIEMIELTRIMKEDNRYEYTEYEFNKIENYPYQYFNFVGKIFDNEILLGESEIDKKLEEFLNL